MTPLRPLILSVLVVALFFGSIRQSYASDDKTLENIFKNAYYGALIGGLLGTAVLIFSDRPGDHFDYIAYGLAGGVIAGTFYGMANPSRGIADLENGRVNFDLPRFEIATVPRIDPAARSGPAVFLPLITVRY